MSEKKKKSKLRPCGPTAKKSTKSSRNKKPSYVERFCGEISQTAREFIDLNPNMSLSDFVQIAEILRPIGIEVGLFMLPKSHPLWDQAWQRMDEPNGGMTGPADGRWANNVESGKKSGKKKPTRPRKDSEPPGRRR